VETPDKLRSKAAALIDKRGLRGAASDIGVHADALARFVAGGASHPATVRCIQDGLRPKARR